MSHHRALDSFPDVLTIRELAQVLRVSESTIKRRMRDGTFPVPPLSGLDKKIRFARVAVVRYLDSGRGVGRRR